MTHDPCCVLCKGPHDICLSRHTCEHHKAAQAQDDANHRASRTIRDPTGDTAIANITRGQRGQNKR
ncbi:hypothetical protein [Arthrobacter sp. ok362]|uniref:hypothetical protein n=1 Tax=Arthrobacter sp. ok362 TaxID=1761745 RepID=UPI00088308AE|nr:hypothetical protein [Arthrobacter sp. ok362]SDK80283.1 hypothetical protein SAMN04487913_103229 [Arthrobacter sp. ok362]